MYVGNTPGYVMTQSTAGMPVSIPVQAAGGVVPGQASYMYAQGRQQQVSQCLLEQLVVTLSW